MRAWMTAWRRVAAVAAVVAVPVAGAAQDVQQQVLRELEALRRQTQELMRQQAELQDTVRRQAETIRRLERRAGTNDAAPDAVARRAPKAGPQPAPPPAAPRVSSSHRALDRALEDAKAEAPPPTAAPPPPAGAAPMLSRRVGGSTLRLLDTSVNVLFAAGTSTANDEQLPFLEGGAHDPNQRGFTLQQAELAFTGAVDPYFTGAAYIVFTPDGVELEEAYLTTQSLPYGLQLEAGQFFTEFGRINPLHPHAWQWIDQPVINTRLFGGDGLRNPGARLGWLLPVPWYAQLSLGAQNATGETAISFLGDQGGGGHAHGEEEEAEAEEEGGGIGGRPLIDRPVANLGDLLYLTRLENGFSITDSVYGKVGASALFGPNATGLDTRTTIYGLDVAAKWVPSDNFRGYPFFLFESEVMRRRYQAAAVPAETGVPSLPATTLYDWGFYAQALYGFTYPWAAGVRVEYAGGSGQSVGGRAADPFRGNRFRLSPLLTWRPTEFSRIRLQYNYDDAQFLPDRTAHSVWLGFDILYGFHPAHTF